MLIAENQLIRPWYVVETGERWIIAARRFAPTMMPHPLVARVEGIDDATDALLGAAARNGTAARGIFLWEVRRDSLAVACQRLARVATIAPGTLQLVALWGLTDRERVLLSEFPTAACISHPEDLPRLAPMIHDYFAAAVKRLD